jgi:hypothetical protein
VRTMHWIVFLCGKPYSTGGKYERVRDDGMGYKLKVITWKYVVLMIGLTTCAAVAFHYPVPLNFQWLKDTCLQNSLLAVPDISGDPFRSLNPNCEMGLVLCYSGKAGQYRG